MKSTKTRHIKQAGVMMTLLAILSWSMAPAVAKDTDIYAVNIKQNCYVLMDNSESMNFGVYQHTIDYGAMFDYLFTLNDNPAGDYPDYIYDTVVNSSYFYNNHKPGRKIYLWKGAIGLTIATINGEQQAFTGDAADPDYVWYTDTLVDTHTMLDDDGNLIDDGTNQRRITVNSDGYILLDGQRLPLGMDIKLHDLVTLYNGTVIDNGFSGLLQAPGYYFSGYDGVTQGSPHTAQNVAGTTEQIYFFVTGNWVNMQAMYNLHYKTNPTPTGAKVGDAAWMFETFPVTTEYWTQITQTLKYPATGNYADNLGEADTIKTLTVPGAQKIQVHFSAFSVQGDSNASTFTKDYIKIYDKNSTVVGQYDDDNKPTSSNLGWSPVINGDKVIVKLKSDNATNSTGYNIDKIRVVYIEAEGGSYLMQNRMNVAKDAMTYVVDEFRGKMNWGFASFKDDNGAQLGPYLNPTDNDDTQRAAIVTQLNNVKPPADTPNAVTRDNTPLMEALQDVWTEGYYGRRNVLNSLLCRKNYIISMTDGFPSADNDNTRINAKIAGVGPITDTYGFTQDPYQYTTPIADYYVGVARWLYTHSWLDGAVVTDPANSYVNVATHHVAFGAKQPMLQKAAQESGGQYIVAYNKEQLIAAFYSLALQMIESVSFTAPVVSVDASNKIQSGDDLYMGLFLPMDSAYWVGNVKKFKLGDGSSERPKASMIYDAANQEAINSSGQFLDNTAPFWGRNINSKTDIKNGGAGEVLLEDVQSYFIKGATQPTDYYSRPIYTAKSSIVDGKEKWTMVKFDPDHISASDLYVGDDTIRRKLINFIHGYAYDADSNGYPVMVRDWILGSIIHSRPTILDYFDTANTSLPLIKRLITVGSNDGMLHVFDDTSGKELFAFIPPDLLPKLQYVQANDQYDTVDGLITLHRHKSNPKYVIFGERRGGNYYWNLDVSNMDPLQWTVAWKYTHSEIAQTWSEVKSAYIPWEISTNGVKSYKDVLIFTGGYDPLEDNFPEPFTDQDNNGTPYKANGSIDTNEWSKTTASQDINNDDLYNKYNPGMDEKGRGIFVVDIDDPTAVIDVSLSDGSTQQILPFSVTYGATGVSTGTTQKIPEMKFAFPATPSVVSSVDSYIYKETNSDYLSSGYQDGVLWALYAVDIYANVYKTVFAFNTVNSATSMNPEWGVTNAGWKVNKVFGANPGSTSTSGSMGLGTDTADQGRKAFYSPTVSWNGSDKYFEQTNYSFTDVTFNQTDMMASLFFGTGDREHPNYTMIRNRFYAIYDDSSVTAQREKPLPTTSVQISSTPYQENNLLNLTCDELATNTIINNCYLGTLGGACNTATASTDMKKYLRSLLTDNVVDGSTTVPQLEDSNLAVSGVEHENDAKGWYIILEDQGKSTACSHVSYPGAIVDASTIISRDNHTGEQVLSKPLLFYNNLYFTTYQASTSDPCHPLGNGFTYALNYLEATATFNLNYTTGQEALDVTDRYNKYINISGIPSSGTLVSRGGKYYIYANVGSSIVGFGKDGKPEVPGPLGGIELYYWRDNNSQQ